MDRFFFRLLGSALCVLGICSLTSAPRFGSVAKVGNEIRFNLADLETSNYGLEVSSNLVNWTRSQSFQANGATHQLSVPFEPLKHAQFFKLVSIPSGQDLTPPTWPKGAFLTGQGSPSGIVNLTWPAAIDDTVVASYNLYYQGNLLTNVPASRQSFSLEGLTAVSSNHFFRVTAVDATGKQSTNKAAMSAMVTLLNQAPVALRDFAATQAGVSVTIDLLANDVDENGDSLRVSSVTQPANGTVTLENNRAIYTPNPGFSGRDVFYYSVSDQPALGGFRAAAVVPPSRPRKVVAHVAALIAYVVDTVAETNEFTDLLPAMEWLSDNLLPNQAGRIVIKSKRALAAGSLNFNRDTHITSDDEGQVNLTGNTVNISASSSLTLERATITAPGGLFFNVGGYFDLINNQLLSPITSINEPVAGLRAMAAPPALLDVNLQANEYQNLKATLDVQGGGDIDIANGQGLQMELDAKVRAEGQLGIKFEKVAGIRAEASLSGNSSADFHGLNQLEELDGAVHATGQNSLRMRNNIAGKLKLNIDDVGELTAEATGTRTDNAEYNVSNQKFTHTGNGSVIGKLAFKGNPGSTFVPSIDFTENGARFGLQATADFADNVKGRFGASYSTFDDALTLNALGEVDTSLSFVDVKGELAVTARGGADGDSDVGASLERVTCSQLVTFSAFQQSLFYVKAEQTVFDRDPRFAGDTSATVGVDLAKIFLGDGSRSGTPRRANILMDLASPAPAPLVQNPKKATIRRQATPPEVNIREVQLLGNPPSSLFDPPIIAIYGGKSTINIESNMLDRASRIVVAEVQAPVTIRKNTITGKGISLDGDIEGEGISGLRSEKYLVDENTITLTGFGGTALGIQDLKDVTIKNNTINFSQPGVVVLNLSAGKAEYLNNRINTSLDPLEYVSMLISRGPGGPALVNASSNQLAGNIQLGPSGYGQFTGNTFTDSIVVITENSFARFNNNDLATTQIDMFNRGYAEITGNSFSSGSSMNAGLGAYVVIQGNNFSESSIDIGVQGSARMSGNTFSQSYVSDDLPAGGFVLSPGMSNSGLNPETDIFSSGDWNGNGCADYSPDCDERIDNECVCDGEQPAVDGTLPAMPQF